MLAEVAAKKTQVMDLNQKQAMLNAVIKDKKARNHAISKELVRYALVPCFALHCDCPAIRGECLLTRSQEELKSALNAAEEDASVLRGQIVKSPEKTKRALKDMEHQLEVERTEFASLEKCAFSTDLIEIHIDDFARKQQHLQQRKFALDKIENDLGKCTPMFSIWTNHVCVELRLNTG